MAKVRQFLADQNSKEGRENLDWILYDSLKTTAGASNNLTFFQNTIGSVGKTRTNMQNAGSLASPKTFLVKEIGCLVVNASGKHFFFQGDDASPGVLPQALIFNTMTFEFKVDPSVEYEGHGLQLFEHPNVLTDGASTSLGVGMTGNAINYRSIKLRRPIMLGSTRAFAINVTCTTPSEANGYTAADTLVYFFLKGALRRNA